MSQKHDGKGNRLDGGRSVPDVAKVEISVNLRPVPHEDAPRFIVAGKNPTEYALLEVPIIQAVVEAAEPGLDGGVQIVGRFVIPGAVISLVSPVLGTGGAQIRDLSKLVAYPAAVVFPLPRAELTDRARAALKAREGGPGWHVNAVSPTSTESES